MEKIYYYDYYHYYYSFFFFYFRKRTQIIVQIIGTIQQTKNVFNGCFPKCFSNASSLGNSLLHISHCGLNQNNIFKEYLEVHYKFGNFKTFRIRIRIR